VRAIILCVALILGGCREQRPPAPSAEQSDQLNEMDNSLNALAQNKEGPEQRPGPSK
jgi:PBP1b-binding outer membrane lipoprotein LpoB